ncbi:MAG: type II toxin-antitoxin system RelE/ParE family toxin [Chloroflexota bacterium]|nr:type II toxin-antitoxin system RelE/ParE family toxin [Chloroflexota bacterium]
MNVLPTYRDRDTERFANDEHVRKLQDVPRQRGLAALARLYAATTLRDLRNPPGNRFEALQGDRKGQYSIRINQRWRVCFEWSVEANQAFNIEIVDYH